MDFATHLSHATVQRPLEHFRLRVDASEGSILRVQIDRAALGLDGGSHERIEEAFCFDHHNKADGVAVVAENVRN